MDSLGEWASIAAAFFTAVAAGAAFLTARQGRELIEAAERPVLDVQVLADPTNERMLRLAIVNTGRGVARGANFAVHAMGFATDGVLGDGFVQAGERVHVVTEIGPLPTDLRQFRGDVADLGALVAYRDAAGFAHYRTHSGKHLVPRTLIRRRPKYPDRVELFKSFFPNIDVDAATRVGNGVMRVE